MACLLTKGRNEPCKDVVGGITSVYFADFDTLGAITYDVTDTDVIDTFGGTPTWFEFKVKGNSSFEQSVNSSRENGTTLAAGQRQAATHLETPGLKPEKRRSAEGSPCATAPLPPTRRTQGSTHLCHSVQRRDEGVGGSR